jgi:ketosteroid isomerase-like protein
MVATGRGSSIELTRRDAVVARFRDGKAVELAYYNDQPRALSAAGLTEQATSVESIDIVRSASAAMNDRRWDRWLELLDPAVVYYEQVGTPLDTSEVLRGRDQVRESYAAYIEEFPDFRSEIDELIDAGDEVVCVHRWVGTGRASGATIEMAEVVVLAIAHGMITEGRVYRDRAAALEAVGLMEQATSPPK